MLCKRRPSSTFAKGLSAMALCQQGASAILLVMGATLVILAMGITVGGQARHELRMSAAEAEAEQAQMLVTGGFNWAAKQADLDSLWPRTPYDGTNLCPVPVNYPSFCVDAMSRQIVSGQAQIAMRVRWQTSAAAAPGTTYGWILLASDGKVTGVRYNHTWCAYETDFSLRSLYGPCVQGG